MAKFKVVVIDYVFQNLDEGRMILSECDAELVVAQCNSADEVISIAGDADALLVTYFGPLDEKIFSALKKCKVIVRYGIGTDNIDIDAATRYGIMVANVPDYCCDEVSEHAVACLLALERKLPLSDRRVRQGEWSLNYLKPLHRIKELTVGIVGMGRIGCLSARKVAAFGAQLIFADPNVNENDIEEKGFHPKKVSLNELVTMSDAILIHAPLNAKTYHLFDSNLFKKMQRKPVIINCARGELINTDALVEALSEGQISGAALDVIEDVPPFNPDSSLSKFENVIISPHSAWYSEEALVDLKKLAAEEVVRVLKGERPKSFLNPEVLS